MAAKPSNNVCAVCLRLIDVPNDARDWVHVKCERDGRWARQSLGETLLRQGPQELAYLC